MGIFPFEDSQEYSPHIHTANDLIGPSVNNPEQVKTFTQATLAGVVAMSNMLTGPSNLVAIPNDGAVALSWDELIEAASYNIYKNGDVLINITETSFVDEDVVNGELYSYYVTAIYAENGVESNPSNVVQVIPMPPIALPFVEDFETGAPYWSFEGSWGLSETQYISASHSMADSPGGPYTNNQDISSTLRSFSLEGASGANLHFMTKYELESGYDYVYLEVSTNGSSWTQLAEFNGTQNDWMQKSYSLNQWAGEPYVLVRFRMFSDVYVTEDGIYIDDLEIELQGVGFGEKDHQSGFSVYPNPFSKQTAIYVELETPAHLYIDIYDMGGRKITTLVNDSYTAGQHSFVWEGRDDEQMEVEPGAYLVQVSVGDVTETMKLIRTY